MFLQIKIRCKLLKMRLNCSEVRREGEKKCLISLSPFIDSDNLIRVGGRLNNSNYSYNVKHPFLLCSKHHLTKIIFEREHKTLFHAGPQLLLAHIRLTYWPLAGRNLAKQVIRNCVR